MHDQFQRPNGAIWVSTIIDGDGACVALGAFQDPSAAVNYAANQHAVLKWPVFLTVDGMTLPLSAFLTSSHAFEWANKVSVWGRVAGMRRLGVEDAPAEVEAPEVDMEAMQGRFYRGLWTDRAPYSDYDDADLAVFALGRHLQGSAPSDCCVTEVEPWNADSKGDYIVRIERDDAIESWRVTATAEIVRDDDGECHDDVLFAFDQMGG